MQLLYPAPARALCTRACAARAWQQLMPHVTILNSHYWGGAKLRLECSNTAKHVNKEQRQVNKKNIGIVEKAQETRFGMS